MLKGFEVEGNTILRLLQKIKIRRLVFLHTKTNTTAGMEEVEVINQVNSPTFFNGIYGQC